MAPSSADIYKNNLALLKKNHPHIHELITKANHPLTGEIVSARNGHPALKIQKSDGDTVVLYDETTDETDIGFVPEDFYGLVYLVGMGMGYTAISLVQQKPDMRFLAIFEPDAEIFSQVLHVTDLSPVLTDHRVIISIGVNPDLNKVLAPARNVLMTESLCYRKHAPSMALDPAYEILVKHVFDYASLYVISGGTIHSYGRFFFSNRLRNFATMHHGALVDSLVGAFSGKPAILVGAGPSLNKNVQYLQYAKGKAVIIAVDSALPALVQNGVLPDFITTVDAFEFSYEKIADQAPFARGTALICTPTVNIKAPKTFPADHVFWAFTENETEKWLSAILASKITIEGVETVAHLNLFSALIMGCSPIIFVGQDLAYSASESHAAHTVLSSKNLMKEDLRSHNKVVWVKGVSGDNVPTGLAYYNMKRFFENIIRKHKGVFLNATEGGAHIEGTEIVTLKEVLKNVCVHFIDVSGQIKSASNKAVKKSIDDIHKEIAVEIKKASSIKSKLAETLKLTDTILKNLSKLRPKEESRKWTRIDDLPTHITNNMRKSDALNNSLDKSLGLWNKLTEITIEGLKFSERMRHKMTWLEQGKGKFIDWLIAREERLRYIKQYRKDVLETYETFLGKITETYDKESSASLSPDKGLDEMHDRLYDLAVHYFNQGDMNLAKSTLNQLDEETSNKAELQFYKGCIALNHIEYQDAETYFASAK